MQYFKGLKNCVGREFFIKNFSHEKVTIQYAFKQ